MTEGLFSCPVRSALCSKPTTLSFPQSVGVSLQLGTKVWLSALAHPQLNQGSNPLLLIRSPPPLFTAGLEWPLGRTWPTARTFALAVWTRHRAVKQRKEREVEKEREGKEEEEGHKVARGQWAPPPMEGEGPMEGQRTAIGQQASPAADKNYTPWPHANPPPPPPPAREANRHCGRQTTYY